LGSPRFTWPIILSLRATFHLFYTRRTNKHVVYDHARLAWSQGTGVGSFLYLARRKNRTTRWSDGIPEVRYSIEISVSRYMYRECRIESNVGALDVRYQYVLGFE